MKEAKGAKYVKYGQARDEISIYDTWQRQYSYM